MTRPLQSLGVVLLSLGLPAAAAAERAGQDNGDVGSAADAISAARRELNRLGHLPESERKNASTFSAPARREPAQAGQRRSAASNVPRPTGAPVPKWLRGVALPDFPVRWDDKLLELLTYYRDNRRGRAHIKAWIEKSGRYAPMLRAKLRAAGLPGDLMFVPMVESGFDPQAKSGVGAVGLWQFVKPTAIEYGLRVDKWADQRVSPEHATEAAIRFLGSLHSRLGSWQLSMAAFNMGYGALQKAIRKYNSNDFWMLASLEAGLPFETVTYVAKITACAIVAKNPARFGLTDADISGPTATTLVDVPGGIGLGHVARAAGLSVAALAELNPELKRRRLPADALRWQVRLPDAALPKFRKRWPAVQGKLDAHGTHSVRLGESLGAIAALYDTTEARLRELNGLDRRSHVRPGQALRVPDVLPSDATADAGATADADGTGRQQAEKPVVAIPDREFRYKGRRRVFYGVSGTDTLSEVAQCLAVTVDELVKWNLVTPDAKLTSGMFLQAYVPKRADLSRALVLTPAEVQTMVVGSEAFLNHHEASKDRKRIRYRTKQGDTLASISKRFGLSVGSIARINRFSRYSTLEPNAELILYVPNQR